MTYADWRDRLAKANDPAFMPIEHIDFIVRENLGQFWATDLSAIVTDIASYPGGAVACRSLAAAGDMEDLIERLKPAIEAWAKSEGCTHCLIEGRDGWRRKHADYRHHQTIIVKDL